MIKKIDGNQSLELSKIIKIVDYGFGNLASVKNAINFNGFECSFVTNPNDIDGSTHLILPGVGSFEAGIEKLKKDKWIKKIHQFVENGGYLFGICLGMQLLFQKGTDEQTGLDIDGIGILDGTCNKFVNISKYNLPLPHIGFNKVIHQKSEIWRGIPQNSFFYFVHSYRIKKISKNSNYKVSITNYGEDFVSFIEYKKVYGAQFHPEKSHSCGLRLIKNFCNL